MSDGAVMIIQVLFESGVKVSWAERHHLLRRTLRGDCRQVNERADASPGKPGDPLDRFLVVIDAVVSGRLRRIQDAPAMGGAGGRAEWTTERRLKL
jgi:hypothetical protein